MESGGAGQERYIGIAAQPEQKRREDGATVSSHHVRIWE